jgi:hypothetical protein
MTHSTPTPPPIDKTSLAARAKAAGAMGGAPRPDSLRPEIIPENLPAMKTGAAWPRTVAREGGTMIYYWQNFKTFWVGGARMTCAGSPRAYHPVDAGSLVPVAEARAQGYAGLLRREGKLVAQGQRDPAPGFLVSRTAYQHMDYPPEDQRRYVDAAQVPYLAVSTRLMHCAFEKGFPPILGCRALIWHLDKGYYQAVPVCGVEATGTALSQRVFRDWSIGHRYDLGIMANVLVELFPGHAMEGWELQDWRPE